MKPLHFSAPSSLDEAVALMRALTPATIELNLLNDAPGACVVCDSAQIQQVVVNLCSNSIQAMRARPGSLTVEVASVGITDDEALASPGLAAGRYVRIAVLDDGEGMSADQVARIFEPFYTTRSVGDGTGLGLPVAHGIVQRHGGQIKVQSKPGVGTVIHVYLPQVNSQQIAPDQAAAAT